MIQLSWLVAFTLAGLKMLSIIYTARMPTRLDVPGIRGSILLVGGYSRVLCRIRNTKIPPLAKARLLDTMRTCPTA